MRAKSFEASNYIHIKNPSSQNPFLF